ncbi:putative uncharacterized protein [Parachlamydia acanthamoebae UV-7]|uniref:NodB homology domain-containing protein n=2 Tax=Parachlamydia acanthamoebae TaxID=83552 RepID=F8KX83_PARAV|nr:polysaccharide deacetylase family protein [Parachlamydia acanthamoebae]KIA78716.1 hypothetical protein DB43_DO00090 [Parachlamydia acanthamoebae]CCB85550.1 putative uncharacterized protein [Parachlamydia acanthamoebae UV-7]
MKIFFRDDDLGWNRERFQKLLNLFASHQTKLNVAAIPRSCEELYLPKTFADQQNILQIHTHGYAHVNRIPIGKRCEFDETRSLEDVEKEMGEGKEILEKLFPNLYFPAFTPPWNNLPDKFVPTLIKVGYKILSRSDASHTTPAVGIQNLDVALSLHSSKRKLYIPHTFILDEVRKSSLHPYGILLHHAMMDDLDFSFLDLLLKKLNEENVTAYFFSELQT